MMSGMDADDLLWWAAYSECEPWGEERGDLRSAIIASEVANTPARFFGKAGKVKVKDMMPDFSGSRKAQSGKEMAMHALMWVCSQPAGANRRSG